MELTGSCHCHRVRYRARPNALKLIECNCSICTKRGALHLRLAPEQVDFEGTEHLSLYQFGTLTAGHFFCSNCGIPVYSNPRVAPSQISLNARTLDDFHQIEWERVAFDGQHWEAAAAQLKSPPTPKEP
ncbi:MAG: GFA family protein [bacterium]|nr:GFA family protein [bacterium]